MNNSFSSYHPIVQFMYFFSVLIFTMFIMQPFFLVISLIASLIYAVYLKRKKALMAIIKFIVPISLLAGLINPLFNHAGITILTYLPDGNPLTLESIIYGAAAAGMFSSIMLWCMCLRYIMSSDRVIYLFGRAAPKLGLFISMILRFIPKLTGQFKKIRAAQRCIGRDIDQGTIYVRVKNTVRIISALLQWILENSVDTADSMKNKGYGLPHRTAFSLFRIDKRDIISICIILVADTVIFTAYFSELLEFYYYPVVTAVGLGLSELIIYIVYTVLCFMPLMSDIKEDRKWNALRSKI